MQQNFKLFFFENGQNKINKTKNKNKYILYEKMWKGNEVRDKGKID